MVGLDQVDAVADRSLVVFDFLVAALLVGKYFDSFGMAAVDQVFRKDRPVRCRTRRAHPRGHGVKARDGSQAEASGGSTGRSPAAFRGRLPLVYDGLCDQAVAL